MKTNFLKSALLTFVVILASWTLACSGRNGKTKEPVSGTAPTDSRELPVSLMKMNSPAENAEFKLKDQIKVVVAPETSTITFDSVKIYFNGKEVDVIKSIPWECSINSSMNSLTGRKSVKAVAYSKAKVQSVTHFVIIYSDIIPKKYGYTIVHTYPHDNDAFTQGLFYNNGYLYEGTGQEAGSSLRQVDLITGKVLKQHNLESSLFGEGITLYKERIYQVTWKNKVGFVYDKLTFNPVNRIYYQNQGWGLTTIADMIVMSDGTNMLYYKEPEMFTTVSNIEVYDNSKKVDQLNELEYINGEIWANIWQTNLIARIDPVTGKVNSYIDLTSVFPDSERSKTNAEVLNGIAYDSVNQRIFVTGKRWPKLYEITVR